MQHGGSLVTWKRTWGKTAGLGIFKARTSVARRGEELQLRTSYRHTPPEDWMLLTRISCAGLSGQGQVNRKQGWPRAMEADQQLRTGQERKDLVGKPEWTTLQGKNRDTLELRQQTQEHMECCSIGVYSVFFWAQWGGGCLEGFVWLLRGYDGS